MAYNSLFDKVENFWEKIDFRALYYSGNLEQVLEEVESDLKKEKSEINSETNRQLILQPARIISRIINYKIGNVGKSDVGNILKDSIKLGLDIYSGKSNAVYNINKLREKITSFSDLNLLEGEFEQEMDLVTWKATNPIKSEDTAKGLVEKIENKPVLFVALAHGGIAAGMDTYLRYCDKVDSNDSVFYTARFSSRKIGDIWPQVTSGEIDYLKEKSHGRRLVIFDEDRYTGKTLAVARDFFNLNVPTKENAVIVANLDERENKF